MRAQFVIPILASILILGIIPFNDASAVTNDTKLTASDAAAGDQFGNSVSISGDTVIVGAPRDDDACLPTENTSCDSGSAYVFGRDVGGADNWGQVVKLTAFDAAAGDNFGVAVSISGDTIIVGAPFDDLFGDISAGSAYVFGRDVDGADNWGQVVKLTAFDSAAGDFFGRSVSILGDTAIVGAPGDDDACIPTENTSCDSGSASVFGRDVDGADNWGQVAKLTASDADLDDKFGFSVSISGDTAIVGADHNDDAGLDSGSAYVFVIPSGDCACFLTETAKLTASDAAADDLFGFPVSISGDTAIVGARSNDDVPFNSGSAYVFVKPGGAWAGSLTETTKLTASDAAAVDQFGNSVSISGDTAIVGAFGDDDAGTSSGSAYVFDLAKNLRENPCDALEKENPVEEKAQGKETAKENNDC